MSDHALQRIESAPPARFGRLKVIGVAESIRGHAYLLCVCDCGKQKKVEKENLFKGRTKSCGCLRSEISARHCKSMSKHGESGPGASREYRTWVGMMKRCYSENDPRFKDYGGRGIRVCERWHSFSSFLADMGRKPTPTHTIERKNNDHGYNPGNCAWALPIEQSNNRRSCRFLTLNGARKTVAQWARHLGWGENIIRKRLEAGWLETDALTIPPRIPQ